MQRPFHSLSSCIWVGAYFWIRRSDQLPIELATDSGDSGFRVALRAHTQRGVVARAHTKLVAVSFGMIATVFLARQVSGNHQWCRMSKEPLVHLSTADFKGHGCAFCGVAIPVEAPDHFLSGSCSEVVRLTCGRTGHAWTDAAPSPSDVCSISCRRPGPRTSGPNGRLTESDGLVNALAARDPREACYRSNFSAKYLPRLIP